MHCSKSVEFDTVLHTLLDMEEVAGLLLRRRQDRENRYVLCVIMCYTADIFC